MDRNGKFKFLKGREHGYIDYIYGALLLLAPMLGLVEGPPTLLCYILGIGVLGLSLLTKYPLGLIKAIPFTAHGWIELAAAFFMLASCTLFALTGMNYGFFMVMSIAVMGVFFVTDYVSTDIAYAGVEARTGKREKAAAR